MLAHQLPHPSGVYPTWNSRPISVLIRPSVHRWPSAYPCSSGPLRSSASSRAHCCGPSFSRDTGPFDLSAAVPPSRQARCQRRTDPSVTLRSCTISVIVSPRANRPAACSRSRRCCPAGVYPVRYACSRHTPRNHPTSRPALYELILVKLRIRSASKVPWGVLHVDPPSYIKVGTPASLISEGAHHHQPLWWREDIVDAHSR